MSATEETPEETLKVMEESATEETPEETLTMKEKIIKVSYVSISKPCQRNVTHSDAWFYSAEPYLFSFLSPFTTGSP